MTEIIDMEAWRRAQAGAAPKGIVWAPTATIFAPLPDPVWACKALEIGPGRPTCFAGYSYSGKTLAVQSAVLAMVAGNPVFGQFPVRKQHKVRHIDYEQGRATFRRYQRLARGHRISPEQLGERLECALFPNLNLTDTSDEEWLAVCEGWDVVVIDALRGLLGKLDENSSEVQTHMSRLTDVSTRTGTAIVIIHHAGKGNPSERDEREILRGSSGIFAALGGVFAILGKKDAPKRVVQVKSHPDAVGACRDDFELNIVDVASADDPHWGMHVGYGDVDQDACEGADDIVLRIAMESVLPAVRKHVGCTTRQLKELAGKKHTTVDAALVLLKEKGLVYCKTGARRSQEWFPSSASQVECFP